MASLMGKLLAVLIVAANVSVGWLITDDSASRTSMAVATALLSLPGVVIVLFRDQLAQTGTIRGVLKPTSPVLLGALGWVFLLLLPAVFLLGVGGVALWK